MLKNNRIGDRSRPPILGSSARKGAITGSDICQINSMAGCRLPAATQLTMIMATMMTMTTATTTMVIVRDDDNHDDDDHQDDDDHHDDDV